MTPSKVVGSILFAADELLRVEEGAVCARSDLVNDRGFKIKEHSSRDMLPSSCLAEKCVEGIVSAGHCFVTRHLAVRLHHPEKD